MSANEELEEHAHHAKDPFDRRVAVTMAIIAAALATVSVVAHIFSNEELLAQQKASDQWAFYQAKSIRRYASDIARDTFRVQMGLKADDAAALAEKYEQQALRYERESEDIQKEAKELEAESRLKGKQGFRMEVGEVFLEIGIVFASLAILSKRQVFWMASILCALIGLAVSGTATLIGHELSPFLENILRTSIK
jgi:hypothetical protein